LCSGVIALVMAAVARIHPRLDLLMRLITDAMLAMPLCSGVIALVMAAVARIHPRLDLLMRLITDAML
ncbi:hypothetical protein V5H41_29815, partial [Salmonella enterica]